MPDRLREIRARLDTRNMKWRRAKYAKGVWHTEDSAWEIRKVAITRGYCPMLVWQVSRSHVGVVAPHVRRLTDAKRWCEIHDAEFERQLGGRRG